MSTQIKNVSFLETSAFFILWYNQFCLHNRQPKALKLVFRLVKCNCSTCCMYVCTWACTWADVCAHMCAYLRRPDINLRVCSIGAAQITIFSMGEKTWKICKMGWPENPRDICLSLTLYQCVISKCWTYKIQGKDNVGNVIIPHDQYVLSWT